MSANDGASIAAQLTGAGNQQAQVSKTETSKDVQNERRQTFKRRHGFLVGFFGLILYVPCSKRPPLPRVLTATQHLPRFGHFPLPQRLPPDTPGLGPQIRVRRASSPAGLILHAWLAG